ncbi:MAG: NAD(P)-binding domain-containing protein [Ruminococcus sp.]|nr:NAD(P)-binding domain-containing protein [Ruminococcus sp.]
MKRMIVFAGGDKRQLFAAEQLRAEGYDVFLSGFEKAEGFDIPELYDIYRADVIVLPVRGIKDSIVPTYYSDKELKLNNKQLSGKTVIMGKAETLNAQNCRVYDLLKREDFAEKNALPSAEGALKVAIENSDDTISGSKILVIGYGRIGKALSRILRALGAEVVVASRSDKKAQSIRCDKNTPVKTSDIKSLSGFDIVFNTADALVIDSEVLNNSDNSALIIDLASVPGGVDFKTAETLGFKAVHALGLPGKYSPKAAGRIISDAVLKIIKEE